MIIDLLILVQTVASRDTSHKHFKFMQFGCETNILDNVLITIIFDFLLLTRPVLMMCPPKPSQCPFRTNVVFS